MMAHFPCAFDSCNGAPLPSREMCVSFTGHRPSSLPWGSDESDARCVELKSKLRSVADECFSKGFRYFLSGMAAGVDIYAEAVLALKEKYPNIGLICVYPYMPVGNMRTGRIEHSAARVMALGERFDNYCMMRRNRFLVEHSSRIICVSSGRSSGGTAATMRMAMQEGLELTVIGV